jgi:hypothetical protein
MANPFGPQDNPPNPGRSASAGKPDQPPIVPESPEDDATRAPDDIDEEYWERCLADAERAEKDWRSRGREIVRIYRNDGYYTPLNKKKLNKDIVFNILYSNTEVMLPNIYNQAPTPIVRSRFVKKSEPMMMIPPPQPPAPPPPPGMPVTGSEGPGIVLPSVGPSLPNGGPPLPDGGSLPPVAGQDPGALVPLGPDSGAVPPTAPQPGAAPPQSAGPMMTPPTPAPSPPGMPAQKDIETAAAVMEKALAVVLDDEAGHKAVTAAVKDLLLPARGTCRVRWKPHLEEQPVEDPVMGGDLLHPQTGEPQTQTVKIWETVNDEYVYWEDLLIDPVRQYTDVNWIAFRHLFDEKSLFEEFPDVPELDRLKAERKLGDILRWTDESAGKDTVGGGGAMKTAGKLGDVRKKAMVWEIWDKTNREVIWMIRELTGITLRVDPDSLGLTGFFCIPPPLLAVITTDSQIPKPYYDLYAHLASDLDEISRRISQLTEKIKVRGGYNSANRDIAQMLLADDGKLLPVDGVDLMSGGLKDHIWLVPILEWVNALKELYLGREQVKAAIYEIMGISDIMRGSSSPYETATAQRIKGTMGTNRLEGTKSIVSSFVRELLRMKGEIVAKNFDAATLTQMTGEEVTPEVEAILKSDFQRTCSIDIETDSTVAIDEAQEQESNAKILGTLQGIMQGAQGMLMTGVLPPPMVIQFTLELIKMMLQPIRNSRGVIDLIEGFQEQLQAQIMMNPMAAAMLPPPGPGQGAAPPPGGPPGGAPKPAGGPPSGPPAGPPLNGGGPAGIH